MTVSQRPTPPFHSLIYIIIYPHPYQKKSIHFPLWKIVNSFSIHYKVVSSETVYTQATKWYSVGCTYILYSYMCNDSTQRKRDHRYERKWGEAYRKGWREERESRRWHNYILILKIKKKKNSKFKSWGHGLLAPMWQLHRSIILGEGQTSDSRVDQPSQCRQTSELWLNERLSQNVKVEESSWGGRNLMLHTHILPYTW